MVFTCILCSFWSQTQECDPGPVDEQQAFGQWFWMKLLKVSEESWGEFHVRMRHIHCWQSVYTSQRNTNSASRSRSVTSHTCSRAPKSTYELLMRHNKLKSSDLHLIKNVWSELEGKQNGSGILEDLNLSCLNVLQCRSQQFKFRSMLFLFSMSTKPFVIGDYSVKIFFF